MSKGPEGEAIKLARQRVEAVKSARVYLVALGLVEVGIVGLVSFVAPELTAVTAGSIVLIDGMIAVAAVQNYRKIDKQINMHAGRQHVSTYGRQTIVNRE